MKGKMERRGMGLSEATHLNDDVHVILDQLVTHLTYKLNLLCMGGDSIVGKECLLVGKACMGLL